MTVTQRGVSNKHCLLSLFHFFLHANFVLIIWALSNTGIEANMHMYHRFVKACHVITVS